MLSSDCFLFLVFSVSLHLHTYVSMLLKDLWEKNLQFPEKSVAKYYLSNIWSNFFLIFKWFIKKTDSNNTINSLKPFFSIIFYITFLYIKISKNSSAKFYQKSKRKLQKVAHERYQDLSEQDKNKKRQYGCERYKNLTEDKKQRIVKYRKNFI